MNIEKILSAFIAMISGGLLVEITKRIYQRRQSKDDKSFAEGDSIRRELREEVKELQRQVKDAREETERWRNKYYVLHEEYSKLDLRCKVLLIKLEGSDGEITNNNKEGHRP